MRQLLILGFVLSSLAPGARADERNDRRAAQARYDQEALGFEDKVLFHVNSGVIVNSWSDPVQGVYRKPLRWDDFYQRVGRDDLAERWRTRRATKIGLIVGGAIAVVTGSIAIGVGAEENSSAFDSCIKGPIGSNCSVTTDVTGYAVGGTLFGAGFIAIFTGIALPRQPAAAWEARQLADQYNRKLHERLGLDEPPPAPPPPPAPAPTVAPEPAMTLSVAPSVGASSGGLALTGRF